MANIIIPSRRIWTRQPDGATDVEGGVAFALLPIGDTFVECESKRLAAFTAGGTNGLHAVGPSGRALAGGVSNFFPQTIVKPDAAFGVGDFAVGLVGSFVPDASTTVAMSNDAAQGAGSNQWRMQPNYTGSAASAGAFCFMTYGGSVVAAGANSMFVGGRDYSFLGVRRGTAIELWRYGVLVAASTGAIQNVSAAETQSLGFGWGTSFTYSAGGNRYLGYGIRGTVSPARAAMLSANPWQIFRPRRQVTYFDMGAGLAFAAADVESSYLIRGAAVQGIDSLFEVRATTECDADSAYLIRSAASQDADSLFSIRDNAIATADTLYSLRAATVRDLDALFSIRSAANADTAAEYEVRQIASSDTQQEYGIRTPVMSEVGSSYDVAASVASSGGASYSVRASVSATADSTYALRSATQADNDSAYALRSGASADLSSSYLIQNAGSVSGFVASEYRIRSAVSLGLSANYDLHAAVQADAQSSYALRSEVIVESTTEFSIEPAVSSVYRDLESNYDVFGAIQPFPTSSAIAAAVIAALRVATPPVPVNALTLPQFIALK